MTYENLTFAWRFSTQLLLFLGWDTSQLQFLPPFLGLCWLTRLLIPRSLMRALTSASWVAMLEIWISDLSGMKSIFLSLSSSWSLSEIPLTGPFSILFIKCVV